MPLTLTRRPNEAIVIGSRNSIENGATGEQIRITVLDVKGKQVRISIEAPENIAVHREEVAELIASDGVKKVAGGGV